MKKLNAISFAILSLGFAASAHAWPKCPDGSISLLNEAGKYVCPSPTPGGQPITVTDTVNANPSSDADAAAKAEAEAKAAAAAIAAALANGGNATGGDAKAISDNWNKLSTEQQQKLIASLSQDQRQALTSTLNNATTANGGAGGNAAGGNAAGGNAAGGNAAGGNATGNGAGNSTTTNTTTTTNYKQVSVLPLFMPTPASVVTTSQIVTERTACGPLMTVTRKGVLGTHIGFFTNTKIDLGEDMEIAPVFDETTKEQLMYIERTFTEAGEKVIRRFGSQSIITTALPTVSAASSMSLGVAGTNGGGNAGGGASSAMSRIVTKVQIIPCELPGAYKLVEVPKGPTRDEVSGILSTIAGMTWKMEAPTQRIEQERVACKVEEFTDASGAKVKMCRGPQGSYLKSRVVPDTVRATGTLQTGAAAGAKK